MKLFKYLLFLLFIPTFSNAQLPFYGDGLIYRLNSNVISNFDPNQPLSATNPINNTASLALNVSISGLAVGENMFANDGSYTFYACNTQSNTYYYYDGGNDTWVNTGHSYGNGSAVNPGMGGGIIYNLVGFSGEIWRYDFTGPATLLTTITDFNGGGPYDLVVDCLGNFYILKLSVSGSGQWLRKYDPTGALDHQWSLVGAANSSAGGGFAIIGDTVYWHSGSLVTAIMDANTVQVISDVTFQSSEDYANIPLGAGPLSGFHDTIFVCEPGNIEVMPTSIENLTWQVSNSNAVVSVNNDQSLSIDFTGSFKLYLEGFSACAQGNNIQDTLEVFLVEHQVTLADTLKVNGCGEYIADINSVINTSPTFIDRDILWSTAHGTITSGQGSNQPVVQMSESGYVYLTITTGPDHGNCTYEDSIYVLVTDYSINPNFDYEVIPQCNSAILKLTNNSVLSNPNTNHNFIWNFGDGTTSTQIPTVEHEYFETGFYTINLNISNQFCEKTNAQVVYITFPRTDTVNYTELVCADNMPFDFFGDIYEDYGMYTSILTNSEGCDSVVHLRLIEADTYDIYFTESICPGTEYRFGNKVLSESGIYSEQFVSRYGCDSLVTLELNVNDFELKLDAYPNPSYVGELVTFQLTANQDFTIDAWKPEWYFPYVNRTQQKVTFGEEGNYTIQVEGTSDIGCKAEVSKTIQVLPIDPTVLLPNAFSPNGDGLNDFFSPGILMERGYVVEDFSVYNRMGQLVFNAGGSINKGWDGTYLGEDCDLGVYVYVIKVRFINGMIQSFKGDVTLIR